MLQKGSDSRKNWREINANSASIAQQSREIARLRTLVEKINPLDIPADHYPYRVYARTPSRRMTPADPLSSWWRRLYVEHGYFNSFKTEGCEDTDGEGTTETEIVVPESTSAYYIYAALTDPGDPSHAEIKHGSSPWTGYPIPTDETGKLCRLLATVDTATKLTEHRAIIRQYQRGDISLNLSKPVWI